MLATLLVGEQIVPRNVKNENI